LSRNNAEHFAQLDEDRYLGKVWARERAEALGEAIQLLEAVINEAQV